MPAEFIPEAGGSVVSNNIMNGVSPLTWAFREPPANSVDNGWRFLSRIDDEEYINDPANLTVYDFNSVIEAEPAVLEIYLLPVGTDLQLIRQDGVLTWVDNETGQPVLTSTPLP